jgi:hypothetical protein
MRVRHCAIALAGVLGLTFARLDDSTDPRNEVLGVYMAELADGATPQQLIND